MQKEEEGKKKSSAKGNTRGHTFEMSVVVDSRWNDDAEKMSDIPKILQLTVEVWSYAEGAHVLLLGGGV